ncbi:MAG: UvrD-helicase domain-containing protein [Limisphaerales bacterium]
MDAAVEHNNFLTPSQRAAVAARGNVLVMAGAGTGKTHTLVQRCVDLICNERVGLDEMLVVTFTEAAASEVRERLREELHEAASRRDDRHLPEQLALFDAAHIGTLHSFCLRLIRDHFHAPGLDPQFIVLDQAQARLLADEILEELFLSCYENEDPFSRDVRELITIYGNGRDEAIRALALRLHDYIQTRAGAKAWLARQIELFAVQGPAQWREWLREAIRDLRDQWLPILGPLAAANAKAAECLDILREFPMDPANQDGLYASLFVRITDADRTENYPARLKTELRKPLQAFFEDAALLGSLFPRASAGPDSITGDGGGAASCPLAEDWEWSRGHMKTLLLLVKNFAEAFAARKRAEGAVDFHDLEQFAIELLGEPAVAEQWRRKFRFVFVDEYQDINAAQDQIISALGAENRFLVGDMKQSIYRFRLADPSIFRNYAKHPDDWKAQIISLTENFRSREGLLLFVNSLFESLMIEGMGCGPYDEAAKLKFGSPAARCALSVAQNPAPRVEVLLRERKRPEGAETGEADGPLADLQESEREAFTVATRLRELKESGHLIWDESSAPLARPAQWRDFAVLLRSPAAKARVYAKQFERAGVPLLVERGGFYESAEILDLLSLLQLADNPLQDVPCIAVLRSPFVGCSLDELAEIRLAAPGHFWFAARRAADDPGIGAAIREKLNTFLDQFSRWRSLARQASLSECLDTILTDTHYDDWLLSLPRGVQRTVNVRQFLNLAEQFDDFQRQGLFRFLKFIEARREIGAEPDVAPVAEQNAVRLMSIHQSKGLEFPIVVVADLGKVFNEQDLRGDIILDEKFGLCAKVKPPSSGGRYPSLAYWLARKNQRRELRGEELRLLYVAMTRARDTLILSGGISAKKWEGYSNAGLPEELEMVSARSCMDWLGIWFAIQGLNVKIEAGARGESPLLRWQVVDDSQLKTGPAMAEPVSERANRPFIGASIEKKLEEILEWKYPHPEATQRAAKTSATALRREARNDEAEPLFRPRPAADRPGSRRRRASTRLSAADAGVAHHKFLQYFAFQTDADLPSFAAEAKRLEGMNYLSPEEVGVLDLEGLVHFWNSELGAAIRANARHARRELAFTAGFAAQELNDIFGGEQAADLDGEMIVVQGVADLAVLRPGEIWLVDFKTDAVTAKDLAEKVAFYSPQLRLYARALSKIYSRPATDCRLHFLAMRETVAI